MGRDSKRDSGDDKGALTVQDKVDTIVAQADIVLPDSKDVTLEQQAKLRKWLGTELKNIYEYERQLGRNKNAMRALEGVRRLYKVDLVDHEERQVTQHITIIQGERLSTAQDIIDLEAQARKIRHEKNKVLGTRPARDNDDDGDG